MTTSHSTQDASAASASLLGAITARDRLAGRARWARAYFVVLAVASLAVVPAIGFGGAPAILPAMLGWAAVMVAATFWARRRGVMRRGSMRLHGFAWGAWGLLWALALGLGLTLYPGAAAFWVPAALVVSAPFAVAAVLAGRPGGVR